MTFAMVPDAAWPGSDQRPWHTAPAAGPVGCLGRQSVPNPWNVGPFLSLDRPSCARVCGVLGNLAPVHRCACSMRCVSCAVSWDIWLLFTGVPARCTALLVRRPRRLGTCSPVCPLGVLLCWWRVLGHLAPVHRCARFMCCAVCAVPLATWLLFTGVPTRCLLCLCGVLGHSAPVHRSARSVCCVACAVSWATWLQFTRVRAQCLVLRVRCPVPLGSCSPVCPLGALPWVCGVLGHLASVRQCARSVSCVVCAVSWATWLLFTSVPARCVVLLVRCPGPLGFCSPVCPFCVLCGVCGVLGHWAPAHRCARSVCCVACAVSRATWLLFTGVPAPCVVLRVWCAGPLGSCPPGCAPDVLCCVCGVLCHLVPVHRYARSVRCFGCAVSWATRLLFGGVAARWVALRLRCPGALGSCSPMCLLPVLCCVCGALGHVAPVHRCAYSVRCFACLACCATRPLFTGLPARCVVLRVRCPGPLGSSSAGCALSVLCCVCGVLCHLAPVHRYARSVRRFRCAVSWVTWLPFAGVPVLCVVWRVWCAGPLCSCSPVCQLGVLCCVCGVLGHLAPVHQCARSVCCIACAVPWATWLLFAGVPVLCPVWRVRCPGPLGSCSPVCPLGVLCCVCGVPGHLAPVYRCARSVCCVACAVSWANWFLSTGVRARCVVLRVRCLDPLGSCSPVCPLGALLCVRGVLGPLAPVHRCARVVCCDVYAVSWATWFLITDMPALFLVLRVRCPGPLASYSPVCALRPLCHLCGVLGHLAPVHRCVRSVCCAARAVSWATWLLFTAVPAPYLAFVERCPWPLGSCSLMCQLGVLCCVCAVLGHLAPVHRCAPSVRCFVCAVSWGTWLLFTGMPARCVALGVRCPRRLGSCSPVCPLGGLLCVCGVLGPLAPVHRCARIICCIAYAVSCGTWFLFTDMPALFLVLRLQCPGPLASCSPVCALRPLRCLCGVLGNLAPVHRCVCSVCCAACAVSWATWLLFTAVSAPSFAFVERCPWPLGSCSLMCRLGVLCCLCAVLGHLAPVLRCACFVRCFVCAVSWATWLLFSDVRARCAVLGVWCPGPLGPCSPVCPLGVLCCLCGVLGYLAPVHRYARPVLCFC